MTARTLSLPSRGSEAAVALAASGALGVLWFMVPQPLLPLAAVAGILCFAGAIAHPYPVCLAFLILSFFRIHEAYAVLYPLHLPLVLAVMTVATLSWGLVSPQSSMRPFMTPELKACLAFAGLATLNISFASDKALAWELWSTTYWKIAAMTLAIAWLPQRIQDFRLTAAAFAWAGIAIGAMVIHNKLLGVDLVEGTRVTIARELKSVLGDPNDLCLILLFPLSFSLVLAFRSSGWGRRLLGLVSLGTIVTGIVFTQSRGGLIGMLAVFATFLLCSARSKVACAIALIVAACVLYSAMQISSRAVGGAGPEVLDESASERLDTWKAAINMAVRRPLTGVGMNNFSDVFFEYTDHFRGHGLVAHSTWFTVLGEMGLPGLVAFTLLVVRCFSSIRDTLRRSAELADGGFHAMAIALFAALVGFCASATFLNQAFTWPIYVLVGLIAALSRVVMRGAEAPRCESPQPAGHNRVATRGTTPAKLGGST